MDKVLEEFEEWFKRDYHPDKTGPYVKDAMLYAWQASRAALCVELPSFESGSLRGYDGDRYEANMVIDCIAYSLDKAGVRYK